MSDMSDKTETNNIPLQERNDGKSLPPLVKTNAESDDANFSDMNPEQIKLSSMAKKHDFTDGFPSQPRPVPIRSSSPSYSKGNSYANDDKEFIKEIERFKKYSRVESVKKNKALFFSLCFIAAAGIFYALAFVSMNAAKQDNINQIESDIVTLAGECPNPSDSGQCTMSDNLLSLEEKNQSGLVPYLIDNDKDGLSDYYELKKSKTDPLKPDSDGDGVFDGAEVYFNLNPLSDKSDGQTSDKDFAAERSFKIESASLTVSGSPLIYSSFFEKTDNISLNGALGLIGDAYEYYTEADGSSAKISFGYSYDMLEKWTTSKDNLSVLKFDQSSSSFVPIESVNDTSSKIVSAVITENGIYALGDKTASTADFTSQVLFLIDNSGSMFPEEMCEGSEENDVDFKRVDFVLEMIDRFDDNTSFAAGKFTGKYTTLCEMTESKEDIKKSVESLRNSNENFSGTEIASSVIKATSLFNQGNNYKNYIILITDGMPSAINEDTEKEARELCDKFNITLITVGIGKQVDTAYLKSFAEDTNGTYYNATNAEALEAIYEKIDSFTSYNQIQITESDSTIQSVVLADSGFSITDDSLKYSNFRTKDFLGGTSFGISQLVSKYYSGTLPDKQNDFFFPDGKEIHGYDLSGSGLIADVRINLNEWSSPVLDAYQSYTDRKDKWDFKNIVNGCLYHNSDTRSYLASNYLEEAEIEYSFINDDNNFFKELLKKITFSEIKNIQSAQCAVVSVDNGGEDIEVIRAINYYQNIYSYNKCTCCNFGSCGDDAFSLLTEEISEGRPAVLTIGTKTVVGIKLLKINDAADKYKLQVYDCEEPQAEKYIELTGTKVYDSEKKPKTQYTAVYNSTEQPLCIYII